MASPTVTNNAPPIQPSAPADPVTTAEAAAATAINTLSLTIEFTGGLEILFGSIAKHRIQLPAFENGGTGDSKPAAVGFLIRWIVENMVKDSRTELFVVDGNVRPGILVLINDADWELEGEDRYELKEGDNVLFVSTLHGG